MKRFSMILVGLWMLAPQFSFAHSMLESSVPRAGSRMTSPPKTLQLRFSEALEPALIKVNVSLDGRQIAKPAAPSLSGDGKQIDVSVDLMAAGSYRVDWNVVSRDGHRTKGSFAFAVGQP